MNRFYGWSVFCCLLVAGCATPGPRHQTAGEPVTFEPMPPQSVQTEALTEVRLRRFSREISAAASDWTQEPSIWPVTSPERQVISRFGPRGRSRKMHRGIDIKAPRGTAVLATADGEIMLAEQRRGYGNYVEIDHGNGVVTAYGHFDRIFVQQGDHVQQGAPIGSIGATGNASTPHVHYEVRVDGQHYDPWLFLPAVAKE